MSKSIRHMMGFHRRGRTLFCAKPFSHNLQFSKTGSEQRKSSTSGRAHRRSRKLEIPPFPFLSLDSTPSWSKSLSSPPRSRIRMLASVELFGLRRKLRIWLSPIIIFFHINSGNFMKHSVMLNMNLYEYP